MKNTIHAESLSSFEVAPDGSIVRLNVRDRQGTQGALELPANCVNQLLLSLPKVIRQALRNAHGDERARLVHALDSFRLDPGDPDENGIRRYVLTLRTGGGYEAAFAMTGSQMGVIVQSVVDQVMSSEQTMMEPVPLNS